MKKSLFIFLLGACLLNVANAQKFFTKQVVSILMQRLLLLLKTSKL